MADISYIFILKKVDRTHHCLSNEWDLQYPSINDVMLYIDECIKMFS